MLGSVASSFDRHPSGDIWRHQTIKVCTVKQVVWVGSLILLVIHAMHSAISMTS